MTSSFYQRRGKRALDVSGAAAAIVITAPIQAVVALVVLKRMGRPIFFRQERPGLHGKPFTLVKFRSMADVPPGTSADVADDGDRLTAFGSWLRATSLDELPELWSVLKGDMSLVGPRPLLMEYLARYSPEQARRHDVRPGLTGWAQVHGRNAISWDEKFSFDIWYVENVSFGVDLRVLVETAVQLLRPRGISSQGQATAAEFRP